MQSPEEAGGWLPRRNMGMQCTFTCDWLEVQAQMRSQGCKFRLLNKSQVDNAFSPSYCLAILFWSYWDGVGSVFISVWSCQSQAHTDCCVHLHASEVPGGLPAMLQRKVSEAELSQSKGSRTVTVLSLSRGASPRDTHDKPSLAKLPDRFSYLTSKPGARSCESPSQEFNSVSALLPGFFGFFFPAKVNQQ